MEKTVKVPIPKELFDFLERLGKKMGKTPNQIVTEIIEATIKEWHEAKPSNRRSG